MNGQQYACCENYRKASKIKGKAIITEYETKIFEKHVEEAEISDNDFPHFSRTKLLLFNFHRAALNCEDLLLKQSRVSIILLFTFRW